MIAFKTGRGSVVAIAVAEDGIERINPMLRKLAVALVATTMAMAPALAADAAKTGPAPAVSPAKTDAAPAVKTVKAVKYVKIVKHHRRHVRHHRHHRRHYAARTWSNGAKPFAMGWSSPRHVKVINARKPYKHVRHVAKLKKATVKKNSARDVKIAPKS